MIYQPIRKMMLPFLMMLSLAGCMKREGYTSAVLDTDKHVVTLQNTYGLKHDIYVDSSYTSIKNTITSDMNRDGKDDMGVIFTDKKGKEHLEHYWYPGDAGWRK